MEIICYNIEVSAWNRLKRFYLPAIARLHNYKEVFYMYAVIETGGKQYKVSEGDVIFIEKLEAAEGEAVTFDKVLVVADGENVKVGAPAVAGATVTAKVEKQGKAKKIYVFKMKRKKNYRRKKGHRQPFTKVTIEKINF